MKYYYAGPDNKTAGPVTLDEIQAMIKNGTLKSDPMVVPEGSSDWKPLSVHTGQAPAGGPPPPPPGPNQAAFAAERAKEASKDALGVFKTLAGNPVAGMAQAFNSLGAARALGVGIAFGVVSAILLVFVSYRLTSGFGMQHDAGFFFKSLITSLVPYVSFVAATFGARMVFRGQGAISHDCFIAGAAILPFALVFLIAWILGPQNYKIIGVCAIFAICLTILMLFSGLTRICTVTERAATLAVPCVIVITIILSEVLHNALMGGNSGMGGFGGGSFPGFQ